jgi:urea transport system ATP-binding protein
VQRALKDVNVIDESNLSDIMLTVGDPNEAVAYFARTAEQNPDRIDLKRGLANSLIRAGRAAEAVTAWRDTVAHPESNNDDRVGLADALPRKAGELSHGQKQWLEIAMLLAQEPRLLLVDEPAAGMTPAERDHTTDLLKAAAKTRAVVVVEHDMEFVRRLDCRVTVLHEGRVLAEGSLDHVTANRDVIDVYLGR